MLDATMTAAIKSLFERHGVKGTVGVKTPIEADEAIFVVSPTTAATMNERALTEALTELLDRKVWVVTEDPPWRGDSVPL
jgi:hypothetical protein